MSIFGLGNRVSAGFSRQMKKLPNRFVGDSGMCRMGAGVEHEVRTNSAEELMDSLILSVGSFEKKIELPEQEISSLIKTHFDIDVAKMAEDGKSSVIEVLKRLGKRTVPDRIQGQSREIDFGKVSEEVANEKLVRQLDALGLKEFVGQMAGLPKQALGVAHDIVDLANFHAFVNHDVFPITNIHYIGRATENAERTSFLQHVFSMIPKMSKDNPEGLNLLERVMTFSDDFNAKYFLDSFFKNYSVFEKSGKQISETLDLVPDIANATLNGSPTLFLNSSCKEAKFFDQIGELCSPTTKPENIRVLKDAANLCDHYKTSGSFNITQILEGNTEVMKENMKVLPQVLENADKTGVEIIDASGFLTHNVNLK